jgi:hypothetical protein
VYEYIYLQSIFLFLSLRTQAKSCTLHIEYLTYTHVISYVNIDYIFYMHVCLYTYIHVGSYQRDNYQRLGTIYKNTQAIKTTTQIIMNTTISSCICFVANTWRQIKVKSIYPYLMDIETCCMKRLMISLFFGTCYWVYGGLATWWLWMLSTIYGPGSRCFQVWL